MGLHNLASKTQEYCAAELSLIFIYIFNLSFTIGQVPLLNLSEIFVVSKRPVTKCLYDLRHIVLTAVPMKVCK